MTIKAIFVGAAALAFTATAANGQVTQIFTPDGAYTGSTSLLPIVGDEFAPISSVTDGTLTISFDTGEVRQVGSSWSTWGSPPDTEDAFPRIVYTAGLTTVNFTFSEDFSIFGIEVEPNPFEIHTFTAEFFLDGVSQGVITRDADGSAGARLLAASGLFDSVTVSSDVDWAFAQVRAAVGGAVVPEPATWAMMIVGFGLVGVSARRRGAALAA